MALENHFYVATGLKPDELLREFFNASELSIPVHLEARTSGDMMGVAHMPGSMIYASDVSERIKNHFRKQHGISPTVKLRFRLDRTGKEGEVQRESIQMVFAFMKQNNWDAALVFTDAIFIVMRKSGEIMLNNLPNFWTSDDLRMITVPYTLVDIPNL